MDSQLILITYKEVLKEIENKENHLLIGNGFNYGLGVNTGYSAIFNKMTENNKGIYKESELILEDCGFDLEQFIGRLCDDVDDSNPFLKKYISNKIKIDFMQATHEIVKSEIKSIYAEKNEGIFLLLQNFTNYFSLNYDSFLYLLLLKFKSIDNEKKNSLAFQSSLKFIEDDLNENQNNIYHEIKSARESGELEINIGAGSNSMKKSLSNLTKTHFTTEIKEYSKTNNKGWKAKDIDRVVKTIFEEEQNNQVLEKIDDGSKQTQIFGNNVEFVFDLESRTQNLFFLHGAFHIYKDGKSIKKITQKSNKALYDRLEEILNNEEQDIVCVFQHSDKTKAIDKNGYLTKCHKKLTKLKGNMVVVGSSLAENDNHIFEKINESEIETLYISTLAESKEKNYQLAKEKFPDKKIQVFNAKTISYELPNEADKAWPKSQKMI